MRCRTKEVMEFHKLDDPARIMQILRDWKNTGCYIDRTYVTKGLYGLGMLAAGRFIMNS